MPAPDPVLTAAQLLAHRRRVGQGPAGPVPETVFLTFQRDLLGHLKRAYPHRRLPGFYGEVLSLKRGGGRVAVAGGFGVGAAVTAVLAEDLAAFGARQFVIVGLAGGLQAEAVMGDVVVVEAALAEVGVAQVYAPADHWPLAEPALCQRLQAALRAAHVPHRTGRTWTVEVPYQLSRAAASAHQAAGLATVEMEAGALLAVGRHLGAPTGAVLVVADRLADGQWRLEADQRPAQRSLRRAAEALINHFA